MSITNIFDGTQRLFVRQIKEWAEIMVGYESKNKYEIVSDKGTQVGFISEQGKGILRWIARQVISSHRPLDISIFEADGKEVIKLRRPFYFFFSTMTVEDVSGKKLGSIHQKFAILRKKYVLKDSSGQDFAYINSGFFKFFDFAIKSKHGEDFGHVKKKWGGVIKEIFSDADTFGVDLSPNLTPAEKCTLLATAICIDLDYFEDNDGADGIDFIPG